MRSKRPLISTIIPVYNGEAFLAEAIQSVLIQNYKPLEIIIVDDGSTDGSAQVAASCRGNIRYTYQSNKGAPAARNKGLKMARGDIISFLDADDLWSEDKLELQIRRMNKNPSVQVVLGRTQKLQLTKVLDEKPKFEPFANPVVDLHLGSALFKRSVFDEVGFFDERMPYCDDWDWFTRAREIGISMVIYREVTLFYRKHGNNITNNKMKGNYYTIKMLKQSLDRRRISNHGTAGLLQNLSDFEENL